MLELFYSLRNVRCVGAFSHATFETSHRARDIANGRAIGTAVLDCDAVAPLVFGGWCHISQATAPRYHGLALWRYISQATAPTSWKNWRCDA
ncbi:hypothetical protein TorRG33x02_304080 [Trema orientale]|uniref:Uncharacterized protein n=1 Tax=Trema orientale TaxID=63057 RepID=A0A2P5BYP4_TREOI|nr:hypothetical protein TorRG33x02_304080 [Trema orientale]